MKKKISLLYSVILCALILAGCNAENQEVVSKLINKTGGGISTTGSTIYGNVYSTNGIPISGAQVKIEASTFAKETVTDYQGFFKFDDIGKREYTLSITTIGFSDYLEVMDLTGTNPTVQMEDKIIKLNYSGFSPAKAVIGKVVEYGTSAAIENALVKIGDVTGRTTSNGTFVLSGIENGKYTVSAEKENFTSNSKYVEFVNGECITNIEITMFRGTGVINVRVIDDYTEEGIASAKVEAKMVDVQNTVVGSYTSDTLGSARIKNVPAGKYKIVAEADNYETNSITLELNSGEEISTQLIRLKGMYTSLQGRVIETAINAGIPRLNVSVTETGQSILTDINGYYYIPDIRSGKYTLEFKNLYYNEPPFSIVRELTPNERREDFYVYMTCHKSLGSISGPVTLGKTVSIFVKDQSQQQDTQEVFVEKNITYTETYTDTRDELGITLFKKKFLYSKTTIAPPYGDTPADTTTPETSTNFYNDKNVIYTISEDGQLEEELSEKVSLTGNLLTISKLLPGIYTLRIGYTKISDPNLSTSDPDYNIKVQFSGKFEYYEENIIIQAGQVLNRQFYLQGATVTE